MLSKSPRVAVEIFNHIMVLIDLFLLMVVSTVVTNTSRLRTDCLVVGCVVALRSSNSKVCDCSIYHN